MEVFTPNLNVTGSITEAHVSCSNRMKLIPRLETTSLINQEMTINSENHSTLYLVQLTLNYTTKISNDFQQVANLDDLLGGGIDRSNHPVLWCTRERQNTVMFHFMCNASISLHSNLH